MTFEEEATFTALDFETATNNPASICQVGAVRFEKGEVTERVNLLVQPPKNAYFYRNIEIHGIKPEDTKDVRTFDQVWWDFKHLIEDQVVVAHNSAFDVNCLRSALAYYEEIQPEFEERCTRTIYRRGLSYLAGKYKINLNHHDALSDAEACGRLFLLHLKRIHLPKTGQLF